MTRCIVCPDCKSRYMPMHPEDVSAGWQRRFVPLILSASLCCDQCNADLEPNAPAVAVTMWRDGIEPRDWESSYGKRT